MPAIAMPAAAAHRRGRLRRLYARIAQAIEIRHRRRILQALPSYLLKDIGIRPTDIDSVIRALVERYDDEGRQRRPRTTS
jgi:uncharacterized protein YjiS (DUF1127 family)